MVITDYRVQSVLRTYTRELQRSKLMDKSIRDTGGADACTEKVSIFGEGKLKLMMNRLTSQILEKMYPKQDVTVGPTGKESIDGGPVAEGNK